MQEHLKELKKLRVEYIELIENGCSEYDAGQEMAGKHSGGNETNRDNEVVLLYKGSYILTLNYQPSIYKRIE